MFLRSTPATQNTFAVSMAPTAGASGAPRPRRAATSDEYAIWLETGPEARRPEPEGYRPGDHRQRRAVGELQSEPPVHRTLSSRPLIIGEDGVYLGYRGSARPVRKRSGPTGWVNAVAAYDTIGGPLIVVDFGTGDDRSTWSMATAITGAARSPPASISRSRHCIRRRRNYLR